ncbi:hypothetical protein ACFSKU_21180 [Pontibacter silvestris]|uniref:Lipocalin-like domain-containing protein n=1 Tax=Pontibacter silvestris TaxID=2305183 RepID=A0ABW4X343_9BACT|nr:hypothetical protein [Pontibacter silvestris]MCC9137933.1 hypothetical protein [Pontibacter silvestris]
MKKITLLCIVCLFLLANTCNKKDKVMSGLVGKTWLHSYEEDEGDTLVYRPNSYDFPPSRGRTGFALEAGGVIKRYDIAPTDGLEEQEGQWELDDKNNMVKVKMQGDSLPPQNFAFEIVSLKDDVLKIKQHHQ